MPAELSVTGADMATGKPDLDETIRDLRDDLLHDLMADNGHPYSRPQGYPSRPRNGPTTDSGESRSH